MGKTCPGLQIVLGSDLPRNCIPELHSRGRRLSGCPHTYSTRALSSFSCITLVFRLSALRIEFKGVSNRSAAVVFACQGTHSLSLSAHIPRRLGRLITAGKLLVLLDRQAHAHQRIDSIIDALVDVALFPGSQDTISQ